MNAIITKPFRVTRFYALLSEGMVYSCHWINRWFEQDLARTSGALAVVFDHFLGIAEKFVVGRSSAYTLLMAARHLDRAVWLYASGSALDVEDIDDEFVAIAPKATGGVGIVSGLLDSSQHAAGGGYVRRWIAEVVEDLGWTRKYNLASQRVARTIGAIKRALSWYEARTLYCAAATDAGVSQYEDLEDSLWEAIQQADRRLRPQGGVALRRVA